MCKSSILQMIMTFKKHQTHVHMSLTKKLSECGTNVFLCAYKKEVTSPARIPLVNAVNLYES